MTDWLLAPKKIEQAQNIYDLFLLAYLFCKQNEGTVLTFRKNQPDLNETIYSFSYKYLRQQALDNEWFKYRGAINQDIKDFFLAGLRNNENAFLYAFLLVVDQIFNRRFPQNPWLPGPLNTIFLEYGAVYYAPEDFFKAAEDFTIRKMETIGDRIENYLENLVVVPRQPLDYQVNFINLGELFHHGLFDPKNTKIAIVPFREIDDRPELVITGTSPRDDKKFFQVKVKDGLEIQRRLEVIINKLEARGIDIIIFPELTFSPALTAYLRNLLAQKNNLKRKQAIIKIVVAGSCHHDGFNRCSILGPDGKELWQQVKMNLYQLLPGEYQHNPLIRQYGGLEDIDISNRTVNLIDLSLGRVSILICLDYILPELYFVLAALKVNCFLLPSMTPAIDRFETMAWWHGTANRAATFLANAYNLDGQDHAKNAFIYLPLKKRGRAFTYLSGAVNPANAALILHTDNFNVESLQI